MDGPNTQLLSEAISKAVLDHGLPVAHFDLATRVCHGDRIFATRKGVYLAHPMCFLRSLESIVAQLPRRLQEEDFDDDAPAWVGMRVLSDFAKQVFGGIGLDEPSLGFVFHTRYAAQAEALAAEIGTETTLTEYAVAADREAKVEFDDHRLRFKVIVPQARRHWVLPRSSVLAPLVRRTYLHRHNEADRRRNALLFDAVYHVFSREFTGSGPAVVPREVAPGLFDHPLVLIGLVKPDARGHRLHDIDLLFDRLDGGLVTVTAKSVEMSEWLRVAHDLHEAIRRWLTPSSRPS